MLKKITNPKGETYEYDSSTKIGQAVEYLFEDPDRPVPELVELCGLSGPPSIYKVRKKLKDMGFLTNDLENHSDDEEELVDAQVFQHLVESLWSYCEHEFTEDTIDLADSLFVEMVAKSVNKQIRQCLKKLKATIDFIQEQ